MPAILHPNSDAMRSALLYLMNPTNNEPPSHYVERIRAYTVYSRPRRIITLLFWLATAAILILSGPITFSSVAQIVKSGSLNPLYYLAPAGMVLMLVVYIMVLVLVRHMATAYFDAVDTLLESNRRKKEPE